MNLIDNKRKLRTTFQTLIVVAMVFYLMNLELPKSFSGKSIALLALTIISCVGLVAIMDRVNCKNVRRWEMILYYVLNIVFVWIIVICVMDLADIACDVARDNIPYADGTEEYYNAYDEIDMMGLTTAFKFVLLGIPSIVMTIVFAIVGIIQTLIQKPENESSEALDIEHSQLISNDAKEEQSTNDTNLSKDIKVNYCSYCGNKVDIDAKFCKYCGREIK
ncbi:MAG: zinc ribbon domain-containing protein [Clostridia bacterium]|nr:zinc ribbon domain-containing protein [Clostridia bacterium]